LELRGMWSVAAAGAACRLSFYSICNSHVCVLSACRSCSLRRQQPPPSFLRASCACACVRAFFHVQFFPSHPVSNNLLGITGFFLKNRKHKKIKKIKNVFKLAPKAHPPVVAVLPCRQSPVPLPGSVGTGVDRLLTRLKVQGLALWSAVNQRSIMLPAAFVFLWQVRA
jgi:hypothetical protein